MPPTARKASTKAKSSDATKRDGGAPQTTSEPTEKPKYFSIFNKPATKPTTSIENGDASTTRRKRRSEELQDVSSPPPEARLPDISVSPPTDDATPAPMMSIFALPVPAAGSSKTKGSRRTIKEPVGKNADPEAPRPSKKARTQKALKTPKSGGSGGSSPKGSLKARQPQEPIVIDLLDDEDTSPGAGPSSSPSTSRTPTPNATPAPPKPVHIFFAPRKPPPLPETIPPTPLIIIDDDAIPHGGSQANPIRISAPPDSPIVPQLSLVTKKPKREIPTTPWPSAYTQHVRPPQDLDIGVPPVQLIGRQRAHAVSPSDRYLLTLLPLPPKSSTPSRTGPHQATCDKNAVLEALDSIPVAHRSLPAFTPLLDQIHYGDVAETVHDAWVDRWRPLRARDVLGNEGNARYLKSWLHTLELGVETVVTRVEAPTGTVKPSPSRKAKGKAKDKGPPPVNKRQTIIRTVEKPKPAKRRRRNDDGYGPADWIVSDDETESEPDYDDLDMEDEPLQFRPSVSPCKRTTSMRHASPDEEEEKIDFSRLTNCILLRGPPGSGKTAAVYACAEELGWDVYEVYPGMGKRSGTNLAAIVEGVCQNHVIGVGAASVSGSEHQLKSGIANGKKQGLQRFFKSQATEAAHVSVGGSQEEPITLDAPESDASKLDTSTRDGVRIRQSLILLEEVDILFGEDKNFWPAVVDLIAASRRPVVMTCNDESIVPLQDLPLQATLYFDPPAKPLMTSYIRCLGLANGKLVSEAEASQLVEDSVYRPIAADLPDAPVHPLPSQVRPTMDLRKAIQQLHLWTRAGPGEQEQGLEERSESMLEMLCDWRTEEAGLSAISSVATVASGQDDNLKALSRFLDLVSGTDAHVDRGPERTLEALAIDRYLESTDDEIGHGHLGKIWRDERPVDAAYAVDEEIALSSLVMARGYFEAQGHGAFYRRGTCSSDRNASSDRLARGSSPGPPVSWRTFDSSRLATARADHQRLLVGFVDEVLETADIPLLPRAAMVLDYVGVMQRMVRIDDMLEAAAVSTGGFSRGGVARRTSSRLGVSRVESTHSRYLSMGLGSVHAARDSWLVE